MKRNRNFLLIVWAASLLGLFAVRDVQGAFKIPKDFVVWEGVDSVSIEIGKDTSVTKALLSADLFDAKKLNYNLTSSYKSNLLFVAHLWDSIPQGDGHGNVKISVGGVEIKRYERGGNFLDYTDEIYVIPFGADLTEVTLTGVVDLTEIGQGTTIYTAVVKRGEVDNITALRWIAVTDSGRNHKQDTIFKVVAGEDGKLKPAPDWIISFKEWDKTANDHRGRADTLYFQKFDQQSTIYVLRNGTDTLKSDSAPKHIGNETYKVGIAAGNSYTIEVTARDKTSKGYYQVTLLADTLKPEITPDVDNVWDSVKLMLKDIYLYEVANPDRRYSLVKEKYGNKEIAGAIYDFSDNHLSYKVTASWPAIYTDKSIEVGYEFYNEDTFKRAKKEVVILRYEKDGSKERFIEVRAAVSRDPDVILTGRGSKDTTYTIRVYGDDTQLESFRLSYDKLGTKPLEWTLDSTGYTSAAVDYTTDSVFAWAVVKDSKATIKLHVDGWDTTLLKGEYRRPLKLDKIVNRGGLQSFNIPVRAEDSIRITSYTVNIKMNWNPSIDSIAFPWTGRKNTEGVFGKDTLRKNNVFDVVVPTGTIIEDIQPQLTAKSEEHKNLFRVFPNWYINPTTGAYSYVVKVTAKEDSTATKTYTFNLRHPSSDASLSFLTVPGFELSPAFSPDHEDYTVIVPSGQESVTFVTVTSHDNASVEGNKKYTLHGDSIFKIVVTAEDGVTKKTYNVRVTDGTHTGIQLAGGSSVQVYVSDQSLHVSTPAAERVSVYSAGGQLLYSLDKPAGKAFVSTFPKGVLIVKGSSGWVKKVALH
jgi:hypothetical protein